MRKVIIKVCVPCKKCKEKAMEHLKKVEGAKEVTSTECKIIVIGDFKVDDILKTLEKFKDKFSLICIEELPPPPKPAEEPPKAKHAEEEKKKEPPKEDKGKEKEKEKPAEPEPKPAEPEPCRTYEPPPCEQPCPTYEPPPYEPPTIIISDSLPTSSYSYEPDTSVDNAPKGSSDMDLAILIGLVLVVMVLLASMGSSSSSSSMTEAAGALFMGFIESTISTLGTLFLIILGLLAIMGVLCLADPRPQPCKC